MLGVVVLISMDGMVSTILATHPILPPYAFALIVALAPLLGWWLAARRPVAEALTVVSLAGVALLTLTPGAARDVGCQLQWPALSLHTLTAPEPAANVIMFILPVFFAGIATRHPFWMAVVGSGLSAQIELAQGALPALGRACDVGDWQANTVGSVIGAGLALTALEFHRNRPLIRQAAVNRGARLSPVTERAGGHADRLPDLIETRSRPDRDTSGPVTVRSQRPALPYEP